MPQIGFLQQMHQNHSSRKKRGFRWDARTSRPLYKELALKGEARMFIAVYEFEIREGTEAKFREAWLEVTKSIYMHCGSFGSRLHYSDKKNIMVAYAQWPNREQWEKDHKFTDELYEMARKKMRECLVQSNTVYKLEVSDDFLQTALAAEC